MPGSVVAKISAERGEIFRVLENSFDIEEQERRILIIAGIRDENLVLLSGGFVIADGAARQFRDSGRMIRDNGGMCEIPRRKQVREVSRRTNRRFHRLRGFGGLSRLRRTGASDHSSDRYHSKRAHRG